ncbi:MAG: hypothetical protein KAT77_00485 [Nanoarchaeota archaeon]|nr:hypothetical protein [Nanoarchaeota archaeon]
MKKEIEIKFDAEAYKEYEKLQKLVAQGKKSRKKPTHSQLLSSINNAIKNIKADHRYGDLIPRKYISKSTIERYGTDKIFRVELIGYWRLLYTLIGDEVKIIAFILEFMDHNKYNKIFGYRKK